MVVWFITNSCCIFAVLLLWKGSNRAAKAFLKTRNASIQNDIQESNETSIALSCTSAYFNG